MLHGPDRPELNLWDLIALEERKEGAEGPVRNHLTRRVLPLQDAVMLWGKTIAKDKFTYPVKFMDALISIAYC